MHRSRDEHRSDRRRLRRHRSVLRRFGLSGASSWSRLNLHCDLSSQWRRSLLPERHDVQLDPSAQPRASGRQLGPVRRWLDAQDLVQSFGLDHCIRGEGVAEQTLV